MTIYLFIYLLISLFPYLFTYFASPWNNVTIKKNTLVTSESVFRY